MATFATTAAPINDTDANFRAWINVWHTLLTTVGGWVQTADTGQINFATATRPTLVNEKRGYALYAMNDSLQATKPIILKLAFGSGAAANTPGVWFSIGTATDGAGNFIYPDDSNRAGLLFDQYSQTAPAITCATSNVVARQCFGSVGADRMVLLMFEAQPRIQDNSMPKTCTSIALLVDDAIGAEGNFVHLFSVERAKDWTGGSLGTHVQVMWSSISNPKVSHCAYVDTDHKMAPLAHVSGMVYVLHYTAATTTDIGQYHNSLLTAGIPATAPIPFRRNTYPVPPGINLVCSRSSYFKFDMGIGGSCTGAESGNYITGRTVALSPYGVARTYRTCAGMRMANFLNSGQDAAAYVHILYE